MYQGVWLGKSVARFIPCSTAKTPITTTQTAYIHLSGEELLSFETFGKDTFSAWLMQPLSWMQPLADADDLTLFVAGNHEKYIRLPKLATAASSALDYSYASASMGSFRDAIHAGYIAPTIEPTKAMIAPRTSHSEVISKCWVGNTCRIVHL